MYLSQQYPEVKVGGKNEQEKKVTFSNVSSLEKEERSQRKWVYSSEIILLQWGRSLGEKKVLYFDAHKYASE